MFNNDIIEEFENGAYISYLNSNEAKEWAINEFDLNKMKICALNLSLKAQHADCFIKILDLFNNKFNQDDDLNGFNLYLLNINPEPEKDIENDDFFDVKLIDDIHHIPELLKSPHGYIIVAIPKDKRLNKHFKNDFKSRITKTVFRGHADEVLIAKLYDEENNLIAIDTIDELYNIAENKGFI